MLKNHLILVVRKLRKEKLYSFVNILGLTVGLTAFLLIALYVRDELSFDQFHANKENIYRVVKGNETQGSGFAVATDYVEFFADDMPQIDTYTRLSATNERTVVSVGKNRLNTSGVFYVDANFFEFFSFALADSPNKGVFSATGQAVITETLSRKLFGSKSPIGQEIEIGKAEKFVVTGIAKDTPANSTIQFQLVLHKQDRFKNDFQNTRGIGLAITYISTHEGHNKAAIERHINDARERPPYKMITERFEYSLLPLVDQRLKASYSFDYFDKNDIRNVALFSGIGVVVLLLAVVNYINLVTAQSIKRIKEIGLRKVIGARKRELVLYQLLESSLITILSFLLAFAFTERLIPAFNSMLDKDIVVQYFSFEFFIWVVIAGLSLGAIAGLYPAFYISRVKPLALIRHGRSESGKGGWLKKGLMLFQFVVTAILLSVLMIMNGQMQYLKEKELGFDADFVIEIPLDRDSTHLYPALKNRFLTIAGVKHASLSGFRVGGPAITVFKDKPGHLEGAKTVAEIVIHGDQDITKALGMKLYWQSDRLAEGQFDDNQILVNYTLAAKMGWLEDPAGRRLYGWNKDVFEVVGIVEDFHLTSLKEEIKPMTIVPLENWGTDNLLVKMNGKTGLNEIDKMKDTYQALFDRPFEYHFLNDQIEAFYKREQGQLRLFQIFSSLAVFISLLGLVALTAYMIEQRRKEVSIRKVLGASIKRLILMLNREYTVLVIIAFLVAAPVAYYSMQDWLSAFKYRISIHPILFVAAFVAFLVLSWLVTIFQSFQVLKENPADILRDE